MQAVLFAAVGVLLVLLGAATATLEVARRSILATREDLDEAIDAARRRGHELEQARRARVLEGELVVVNTPKPDDQSIRGVVDRELDNGLLCLKAAVYLERDVARGRETVREVPVGDVVVAGPKLGGFAQVLVATPGQEA